MNEVACPAIVRALLERLCYLVTDREWQEVIDYSSRFMERDRPDIGITTMRFAGLEVIKRSSLPQEAGK